MKKHVRFLASALSLVLALSLCAPALAAEGEEENYLKVDVQDLVDGAMDPSYIDTSLLVDGQAMIEAYRAAHPGELEGLDINDLLAREGYQEPMEAYMEDYGYATQEKAEQSLYLSYIWDQENLAKLHAQADAYREADPESWERFDADAYLAKAWSWTTKEKYMEMYGLYTEEDFADQLYMEYMNNSFSSDWWNQLTPNPVTLWVNGELCATDGDGVLTVVDGTSYVDVETLNAILGTKLEGDKLPVRDAAEAAGWDVVWNENTFEAVLVDRESMMAVLEEKLGGLSLMLDKLRAQVPTEGKSLQTKTEGTLSVTLFHTLDGDRTVNATYQGEALQQGGILNETLTYDATELMGLIPDSAKALLRQELGKADAAGLDELMGKGSISIIQNPEEETMWVNFPALSLLDKTIGEDAWLALDIDELPSSDAPLPEAYYQLLLDMLAETASVEATWNSFTETLELLTPVGEATLTADSLTWTLTTAQANEALSDKLGQEVSAFKELNVTFSATAGGKITLDMALRLDKEGITDFALAQIMENSYSSYTMFSSMLGSLPDGRLTCHLDSDGKTTSETMTLHIVNQCEITLEAAGKITETTELPMTMPPEGAQVIENDPV